MWGGAFNFLSALIRNYQWELHDDWRNLSKWDLVLNLDPESKGCRLPLISWLQLYPNFLVP